MRLMTAGLTSTPEDCGSLAKLQQCTCSFICDMVATETVCQKTNGTEIYEVSIVLAPSAETMSDTNGKKIPLLPYTVYCLKLQNVQFLSPRITNFSDLNRI